MKKVKKYALMLLIAIVATRAGLIMVEDLVGHPLYDSPDHGWVYTFTILFVGISTSLVWAAIIVWGLNEFKKLFKDIKNPPID